MKQGVLPFQYEQEKSSPGMTAVAGRRLTTTQVVSSLILLNLAGGESVVRTDGTLSWSVPTQPWSGGDMLIQGYGSAGPMPSLAIPPLSRSLAPRRSRSPP